MNTNKFFKLLIRNLNAGREICYHIYDDENPEVTVYEMSIQIDKFPLEVENNISFLEDLLKNVKNKNLHYSLSACTGSYGPNSIMLIIYEDMEHATIINFYDDEAYHWAYKFEPKEM